MKFGIMFANLLGFTHAEGAVAIAQSAEAAGFESLWAVEHVVVPAGYKSEYPYAASGRMPGAEDLDIPDPLVWLTYVAGATTTIRLATGILILAERNPVVTAKEVATLDMLSNGRVTLGVGVGWLREEFDAIGVPFERRGQRLDENIEAMRALWTEDKPTYHGEFVSFTDAICRPRPAQDSVPIVIGGHTEAAARRAGRLGEGFFPGKGDTEHLVAVMRDAATAAGRDPDAIELTAGGADVVGPDALEAVARLADLGAERIVIPPLAFEAASIHDALAVRRRGDCEGRMTTYVAVIGATVTDAEADAAAERVGSLLAEAGAVVVTGGREGIAAAASRGAAEAGGLTVGILPGRDRTEANPWVQVAVPTGLGELRNALVVMDADAVIAFPGAYGTLIELGFALHAGRSIVVVGNWPLAAGTSVQRAMSAEEAVTYALSPDAGR